MPMHQARGMGVAWPPPRDAPPRRDTGMWWLVPLWSVGFVGADSKTGEEQRAGFKDGFRIDSTFVVSGSSEPMSTWEEVAVEPSSSVRGTDTGVWLVPL